MSSVKVKLAQTDDNTPAPVLPSCAGWLEFVAHLARKHAINGDLLSREGAASGANKRLRNLWELSELSAGDFADEVARFFRLPRLNLSQMTAAAALADQFSRRFLRESTVFPCRCDSTGITLVVADPTDVDAIRGAEIVLGGVVALAVASYDDIGAILSDRIGEEDASPPQFDGTVLIQGDDDIESLRDLASGAPVVRAVNDLLEKAIEWRATDIHIEPVRTGLIVRMRVDGLLRVVTTPLNILPQAVVSRIKILAGLNIAERRLPQDGAAHVRIARADVDIRVATMPTQHGESAVIRLLPRDRGVLEIARLGLSAEHDTKLRTLLTLPHGIIVVTGPTGSGKTTTLATMLSSLNDSTRKILTIEDPVEYEIRGISQSQVRPEIGLTFATALRAFVRQDPDVIMVGEVRDSETARIAIHAALTGHLVLTTLHTETAAAALPRLLDLGVENFLLQSTLRAVIAQRLVRVLCDRCKRHRRLTPSSLADDPRYNLLGLQQNESICEPVGCERCNGTGYRGRVGVFEILETDHQIRELIASKSDSGSITAAAKLAGMTTMFEHGVAKCRSGVTSPVEVLRVTTVS